MTALFDDPFKEKYYKGRKSLGNSRKYYTVFIGRNIGVYNNWEDTKAQIEKFGNGCCKSYSTYSDAEFALREFLKTGIRPF